MSLKKKIDRLRESLAWRFFPAANLKSLTGGGFQLKVRDKGDWSSASEVFIEQTYDPFFKHLGQVRTWLDLGCNAGYFSLGLLDYIVRTQESLPKTKAALFDASKNSVAKAAEIIALNKLQNSWTAAQGVIGPFGQEIDFYEFKFSVTSNIFPKGGKEKTVRVRTTPLAEIAKNCGFSAELLKADIEGAEKFLFEDEPRVVRSFRYALFEWHTPEFPGRTMEKWILENGGKVLEVRSLPYGWDIAKDGHSFDAPVGIVLWENSPVG